jgi:hypothetical protein
MKKTALATIVFLSAFGAFAQSETPVSVRFVPFQVHDIRPEEGRLIESLILSYISDIDGISIYMEPEFQALSTPLPATTMADSIAASAAAAEAERDLVEVVANIPEAPSYGRIFKSDELGSGEESTPDYVLSGSIYLENDNHVLSLNLDSRDGSENIKRTEQYKNASEMALNMRSIIEAYFSKSTSRSVATASRRNTNRILGDPLPLSVSLISGTWQGDNGIEIVRFSAGGKAVAYFSSGAAMELKYTIENDTLTLIQQSQANYRYYHPLPPKIAREVAKKAEPMHWTLFLYNGGRTLSGTCMSTSADYDEVGIKKLMFGNVKKTNWSKISY